MQHRQLLVAIRGAYEILHLVVAVSQQREGGARLQTQKYNNELLLKTFDFDIHTEV